MLHYNKLVFSRPEEYKNTELANYEGASGFSSLLITGQSTEKEILLSWTQKIAKLNIPAPPPKKKMRLLTVYLVTKKNGFLKAQRTKHFSLNFVYFEFNQSDFRLDFRRLPGPVFDPPRTVAGNRA